MNCSGLLFSVSGEGGYCSHRDAWTGVFQWNGQSYCIHCCKHNFIHKNFIYNLGDGLNTCTLCFSVVDRCVSLGYYPKVGRRGRVGLSRPKIVVTCCNGKRGRVRYD